MNKIIINGEEYKTVEELYERSPIYCRGSDTGGELVRKKKITEYVYARIVNNKWEISNGKSRKYDKVLFKKSFYDTIEETRKEKEIVKEEDIPEVIKLEKNEKFTDGKNNIIEIETRGERKADRIYFKVRDVMKGFEMNRLDDTITDKRKGGYIEGEHYVYFKFKAAKAIRMKKELYLTYKGMHRIIMCSKNACTNRNSYVMTKWLNNFDRSKLENYSVDIERNVLRNKVGCVYLARCKLLNAIKIGMWRSTIELLYSRYITCYGNDVNIEYYMTNDARELEQKTHKYFWEYRITNELFEISHYDEYVSYIKTNAVEIDSEIMTDTSSDMSDGLYMENKEENSMEEMHKNKLKEKEVELKNMENELREEKHQNKLKDKDIELRNKDIEILQYKIKLLELQHINKSIDESRKYCMHQ
jgi:hypothetical protein